MEELQRTRSFEGQVTIHQDTAIAALVGSGRRTVVRDESKTEIKTRGYRVQVYAGKPPSGLGNPARELVAFDKTKELEPGQFESFVFDISAYDLASFDDSGVTGHKNAYVLEKGNYSFYVGSDVRSAVKAADQEIDETVVVEQLTETLAPTISYKRMKAVATGDGYSVEYEDVPVATVDPEQVRVDELPKEIAQTGDKGYKLSDVYHGKVSMDDFIAQFSDKDLVCICRGEGMSSPKVTPGCGGAFGGVTDSLLGYGIPVACCSDGPSGIRMDSLESTALSAV